MAKHNDLGAWGEKKAVDFLRHLGYTICDSNYKVMGGEIDIIALDSDIMVFIEVKTRSNTKILQAYEAVDYRKQQRLIKTATQYIIQKGWEGACRFDIIEILVRKTLKIKHWINAFE